MIRRLDRFRHTFVLAFLMVFVSRSAFAAQWLVYPGGEGPGQGKRIVFNERSREAKQRLSLQQSKIEKSSEDLVGM